MTSSSDSGPLAALLGRSLAANTTPIASAPAPAPNRPPARAAAPPPPRPRRPPPRRVPLSSRRNRRRRRNPLRNRNRNRLPTTPPKWRRRKPARSSTSSSSPSPAPATTPPSARPRRCPTWRARCGPRATLLCELLAARHRGAAELDRDGRWPAADGRHQGRLPRLRQMRLLGRNPDPGRPARPRQVQLARLHGEHGQPRNRPARQLRLPAARRRREAAVTGGYAARLNPFVYFHSLLDLGDCATNDVPLTELEKDLKKPKHDAELLLHLPQPLQRRDQRPVRRRQPRRRRRRRRLPRRRWCRRSSPPPPTRRTAC